MSQLVLVSLVDWLVDCFVAGWVACSVGWSVNVAIGEKPWHAHVASPRLCGWRPDLIENYQQLVALEGQRLEPFPSGNEQKRVVGAQQVPTDRCRCKLSTQLLYCHWVA